ncbi:uncharacterized protein N7487_006710 [Penicillium crustosum]|uniref:uncharacterized protein n=1 Tax=Penicillium crustosum TaxID=36656 RepID=UPI0023927BB6|nr:uncharacterized protein N7487_006710 [Penicillium crustosum]KAJ5412351.1 hypothetical protein N7487_006710 [Penicillium crustosum]
MEKFVGSCIKVLVFANFYRLRKKSIQIWESSYAMVTPCTVFSPRFPLEGFSKAKSTNLPAELKNTLTLELIPP